MERGLIDQLTDSETALVCNALSALDLSEPHIYAMDGTIECLTSELPPMVGQAITIKIDSCTPGGESQMGPYHEMLDCMEESSLPQVVVVETTSGTPMRECVVGDGMAKNFIASGGVGIVTDGGARDMPGIIDQGFRVFASGRVVQHGQMRWSGLGEPVSIGGVTVRTGDLVHGDQGGCIVVPEENHPYIVEASTLVARFEKQAHIVLRRTDISNREKRALMEEISGDHMERINALK